MRRIAILASIILLLALAACSEEPTPEPEPTPATEVDQPTTAPQAEPTQAPAAEPTEEPVAEPTAEAAVEPPAAAEPAAEPTAETAADPRLLGVQWHWEEFHDMGGSNSFNVPDPNDYKILFNADGTANIKADCNTVQATYETDGSSLSVNMGPSTMAFCGEESLDQIYLAQLDQVVSYVIQGGILHLNLMADAGNMVFGRGPLTITPEQISLDTEALGTTWEAFTVAATPYDESTPPSPKGLPEHIEILFGGAAPGSRFPPEAVMYIIPVNAYRAMWEEAGNESVSTSIDAIQQVAFTMVRPENGNLPALPVEEIWGPQDLAVQFARALPAGAVNETSATQTGYRFVGRWAQDANPVTNQNLRYVYQGFTNDGYYLVSFWYPTTSPEIPNDPSEVSAESMEQFNNDYSGYMAAETARLDALESSDWVPDLAVLDDVVVSLQIEEMPSAGLQEKTWLWTEGPAQPGSSEIAQIEDPALYQVKYGLDGTVNVIADCNLANFPYEINWTGQQGGMLVQPGPVTLAFCGEESYSESFINSIQAAQNYRVLAGGNVLELVLPAGGGVLTLVDLASHASTVDPVEPEAGEPTATVTTPLGANVRVGPGTEYPIIGVAPLGATGRVVGVSEDGEWWAIFIPGAPNNQGWVADSTVEVENVENVPVIPAPPAPTEPTPQPLPTATLPPSTDMSFAASRTTINAGETVLLTWSVEGVTAVYMFPVGANYQNYPTTGQGSKEVMPGITTTYVLLAFNADGSSSSESIEITVVSGLTASRWTLQSYSSPDTGYQTVIPGTQISARFEANGNLSGSAGCNDYSGGFTAYDQTLQVGGLTATRVACGEPPGVMEQESAYLSLLGRAARFSISAGQLSVFDSAGNRILVYNAG